jgi:protein-S-isoprenylcysteine O-methyltransferase Ste14
MVVCCSLRQTLFCIFAFIAMHSLNGYNIKLRFIQATIKTTFRSRGLTPNLPLKMVSRREFSQDSLKKLWNDATGDISRLFDSSYRSELLLGVASAAQGFVKSLSEGEVGKRGEKMVGIQLFLMSMVLFGIPTIVTFAVGVLGMALYGVGLYGIVRSVWEMQGNLSPFVSPISGNKLIQSGLYEFVRHPLYGSLIAFCAGTSILSRSIDKLVLTVLLAFVLDRKASAEESNLKNIYPFIYDVYISQTRKLFIFLY